MSVNTTKKTDLELGPLRVAYLCDGQVENCRKTGCALVPEPGPWSECRRTTDPKHAINGPCEDPWNHPERFEPFGNNRYVEVDK